MIKCSLGDGKIEFLRESPTNFDYLQSDQLRVPFVIFAVPPYSIFYGSRRHGASGVDTVLYRFGGKAV